MSATGTATTERQQRPLYRGWQRRVRHAYQFASLVFMDPRSLVQRWRGVPHYLRNWKAYSAAAANEGSFRLDLAEALYTSYDRFGTAGSLRGHYFLQDLWAARQVIARVPSVHVDVGSRLDGFVAHVLPACEVLYVDVRVVDVRVPGLIPLQGSVTELPLATDSVMSLSCLHVLEHIGLGRYGDPVDHAGHVAAARELQRVVAPGGTLLIGTPVGRERLCFDAHRVFDPATVVRLFDGLHLETFALVPDSGDRVLDDADLGDARRCEFACGLFRFGRAAG